MKKITILVFILSILFCGCSQNQSNLTISKPYEIGVDNNILSYYGEKSDFENAGFDIVSNALESIQSKNDNVFVNKEGNIRNIVITNEDIITYKNISVGDSVDEIENTYVHEKNFGDNTYYVLFDKTTEVNPMDISLRQDDFIWIIYLTNDKTIEKITIRDVLYGRDMK